MTLFYVIFSLSQMKNKLFHRSFAATQLAAEESLNLSIKLSHSFYKLMTYLADPDSVLCHVFFRLFRATRQALAVVSFERFAKVYLLGVVGVALVAAVSRCDATPAIELKKRDVL